VIRTNPPALTNDVDPSLDKITVTFNYPMADRSWSWTGSGELYPKTTGSPSYDTTRRVCTLPVQLEPGKVYRVGVNSKSFKNFRTAAGVPVPWYVIVFATRSADGKPTPIPQELQQEARGINQISDAQVGTSQQGPPKVVRSTPKALADNVAASQDKITVTFDQAMLDGDWSWTGSGETYPETPDKPSYDAARRTCTLPVKLEPGKVYWVGVNSPSYQNFRAADGTPATRYVVLFATESADGKPTPIPQDLLDQAREINGQSVAIDPAGKGGGSQMQRRAVGKAVAIFPEQVDLSTPEGAAAAWNRASGKMDAAGLANLSWRPLDPEEMDRAWKSAEKKDIETYNKSQLNGVIVEVLTYKDDFGAVITFLSFPPGVGRSPYSLRYLGLSNGQWKNMGEDRLGGVGEARQTFQQKMERIREQFHQVIGGGKGSSGSDGQDRAAVEQDRQQAIQQVFADPEPIVAIANKIFEAIRTADYDRWINGEGWGSFPMVQYYQTYQWYDALVPWICKTFKADPIKDVTLGKVTKNEDGLPAIPYKLTLASGKVMEGILPFNYKDGRWYARWGLDWHLGNRMRLTEARKTTPPAGPANVEMRVINKLVSTFPAGDLSTPENAAASYNRASGGMDAKALAAVSLAPVDAADMRRAFEANRADMVVYNKAQLTATIVQVLTYREGVAKVITKLNFPPGVGRHPFSGRTFGLFNSQWKNMGEDRYPSPEAARAAFEKGKDAIWDDYMQDVQGQNAGGGGPVGTSSQPAADARTRR
jgi:hypothetical protein